MSGTQRSAGRIVMVILVLAMATAASAQLASPGWIVPVVVKSPGAGGTSWSSDLFVTNLGDARVELAAHYFEGGQANTFDGNFAKTGIQVAAGQTLQVNDVVGTWFPQAGSQTKGWLIIAESAPECPVGEDDDREMSEVIVSTRVYNRAGGGATYGQIIEAQWTSINASQFPSVFTGIRNQGSASPGFRTNLGVVNLSTVAIQVRIVLYNAGGAVAGTTQRSIQPLSLEQWSLATLGFAPFQGSGGRLEVSLVDANYDPCDDSEEPLVCADLCDPACNGTYSFGDVKAFLTYASNIDNMTGDGENMIPVVDHVAFFDWSNDYMDANCPDEENQSKPFAVYIAERAFGVERKRPPAFRRVDDN